MKSKALILLIVLGISELKSQETTYGGRGEGYLDTRGSLGSMVIIPFEDKMYMSDADAPIGKETGLQPGEIMTKFRYALVESLEKELSRNWEIQVVVNSTNPDSALGLEYVHASINYKYQPIGDDVLMADDSTLKKKDLKKKKGSKTEKSGMIGGEIVTHSEKQEKFMNVNITNDTLMQFMDRRWQSDYYIFLSEFDIRYHITNPDKVASGGISYRLKVHFSCLDKSGKSLSSGAATTIVNASSKNIYEIIALGIPELSEKLAKMIRKFELGKK